MRKDASTFGRELRKLREGRGWSVRALASESKVSSVWITLVENGHRTIGAQAVDKLARGLGLREPALTRFRLAGLAASQRDDLLAVSRSYGPVINNALALYLDRLGIRPRDLAEAISEPAVSKQDLVRLVTALEQRARSCQRAGSNVGGKSTTGPVLEIRFQDGRRAFIEMLVTERG